MRPLVVVSIVPQVKQDPKYALQVADIQAFEQAARTHPGRLGRNGAVGLVQEVDGERRRRRRRSRPIRCSRACRLAALKFLHLQRHILFHGHEPLDTDTTPTLEGESWLMHHGYTQAEGVANLEGVPATGCLVGIGYPKFKGGVGG